MAEDPEVSAAAEANEGSAVADFIRGLLPGSSLVDALYDNQNGNYVSAALNGGFGFADLASLGSLAKVRDGGKIFILILKSQEQDAVVDAVSSVAGNAVAERLGPEAEIATKLIASATFSGGLNRNVSRQNKTHLGFAADGGKDSARNATSQKSTLFV